MWKKIVFTFLLISIIFPIKGNASSTLTGNQLLQVNGKIITKTTTINEINQMFGTPKVTTKSAFGGYAYSYFDDNYSYYIYLETDEVGSIISYGAIGGNFGATLHSYHDPYDGSNWQGELVTRRSKVIGALEYNGLNNTMRDQFWDRYLNDSVYLYELQKHAIHVAKAIGINQEYTVTPTYISEDLFYQNEQLKLNGSNIHDYAKKNGKEGSIKQFWDYPNEADIVWNATNSLPNAIKLGETMGNYACGHDYLFFDVIVNKTNKKQSVVFTCIDDSLFKPKKEVLLTDEEKEKYDKSKESYQKYLKIAENLNQTGNFKLIEPIYQTLPLVAGKYNVEALEGVTYLLNAARLGIGIDPLILNEELVEEAQSKATLTSYISYQKIENNSPHYPKKPDGVDEEFYQKAQKDMNENLYMGGIDSSIMYALHDGYGDPIQCGHRYNLLNPYYKEWGVGSTNNQGAHKFRIGTTSNPELVAWPSNGIFPLGIVYPNIGNWTAQFYRNYKITKQTTVTIKNLTNDEIYEISKDDTNHGLLLRTNPYKNMITFRDDNLIYGDKDVFEITLHNVEKNDTEEMVDYTYRSIFTTFDQVKEVKTTGITVNEEEITLNVGEQKKINAMILPSNATNKLTNFKASNQNMVAVRQDGMITALKTGKTTLTITSGDITKTVKVNVKNEQGIVPDYLLGDMNQDGNILMNDVLMALRIYLKLDHPNDELLLIGDINGDAKILMNDVIYILRAYLKLV